MAENVPEELLEKLMGDGATYDEITDYMTKRSFRRRKRKLPIEERVVNGKGKKKFYINDEDFDPAEALDPNTNVNHSEPRRQTGHTKQVKTQKANEFLTEYEKKVKNLRNSMDIDHPEMSHTDGKEDIVLHRTDDHFGEVTHDIRGNEVFNSDICEARVRAIFQHTHDVIDARESMGHEIENAHVLLGGDHVTNEAIYKGQWQDIDAFIDEQIRRAVSVYDEEITELADRLDHVQIVCQAGNHGEFRVDGGSKYANADNIFFDILEMLLAKGGVENVSFVKSDRKDHTNFMMRGHKGHLRHGQHVSTHIGTASPLSDWRSFLVEYEFDVAYRGHYHEHKIEHVNGTPVIMGPSIKPAGEYEGTMAIFGEALGYVHGVNDSSPIAWTEYVRFMDND